MRSRVFAIKLSTLLRNLRIRMKVTVLVAIISSQWLRGLGAVNVPCRKFQTSIFGTVAIVSISIQSVRLPKPNCPIMLTCWLQYHNTCLPEETSISFDWDSMGARSRWYTISWFGKCKQISCMCVCWPLFFQFAQLTKIVSNYGNLSW